MKPDIAHLEHLGIARKTARDLALVCYALDGKTVIAASSTFAHAELAQRELLELLQALDVQPKRVTMRGRQIEFDSGGSIRFLAGDVDRRLAGMRPDLVDGGHLMPPGFADFYRAQGVEVW